MRAKLVHGTNSMTWANRVLPTYMRTPRGSQPGESTRFLARKVQVGTKRNQPTSRANARYVARDRPFNRTVVKRSKRTRSALAVDFVTGALIGLSVVVAVFVLLV